MVELGTTKVFEPPQYTMVFEQPLKNRQNKDLKDK